MMIMQHDLNPQFDLRINAHSFSLNVGVTTSCEGRRCAHADAQRLELFATQGYEKSRLKF